jgi:HEAT repeat protein
VSDLEELGRALGSEDADDAGRALADLVAQGRSATPILIRAAHSDSADARRRAMEGLGTVADPAARDEARRGLEDPDGRVRSLAAVALSRLDDPDALRALLDTIDDWPDLLHSEMSRSAYELAARGPEALPYAIPLLASDSWTERARGAWIIATLLKQAEAGTALAELKENMSGYDPDGDEAGRRRVAEAAARWLERDGA